jgi:hypothetical protein
MHQRKSEQRPKKQELLFSRPVAMILLCPVCPVVAAVLRLARTGDLGLKVRSKIHGFFNARDPAKLPRVFCIWPKREK